MKFLNRALVFSGLIYFGLVSRAALAAPAPAPRHWAPQYATFFGGSNSDDASAIAVDGAGNFYVAGATSSPDFPGAQKPPDTKRTIAFLSKFSPSYQLLWTRFVGEIGLDSARGIALDKKGNVYLVGSSESGDIPLLGAPLLPHSQRCAFLARFSKEGELQMATQIGGSNSADGQAIVLDGAGDVWIAGTTYGATFPTKDAKLAAKGKTDVWVSKLAPSGELLFSTLVGGSDEEAFGGLCLAPDGGVALAGTTASTDFPVVKATQAAFGGAGSGDSSSFDVKGDAWVAVLDAGGKTRWATYFGGRSADVGGALAFAPNGDLWLTGSSASHDLPLKALLPDGDKAGGAFLARFKGDGSQVLQSTFVPDAPRNGAFLGVEANGDLWLGSGVSSFGNSYQFTHIDPRTPKIVETIPWESGNVRAVARDGSGALYLTGAGTNHLPTRRALMMAAPNGGYSVFIAVLKMRAPAPVEKPPIISVDAPAKGLAVSGTTNVGDEGEVQILLYRSADSNYWTGTGWSGTPTWLGAKVSGGHWTLNRAPQSADVPSGDYYLHAVAVSGAQIENFLGPEYPSDGRAKTSRKIVVAP